MSCCHGIRIAGIASIATATRRSCASNISAKGRRAWRSTARAAPRWPTAGRLQQLMFLGSFGEYCIVSDQQAIPVPKEIPFDRACLIGCGVMTGVGAALNLGAIAHGDTVMVIGCGAVGLAAVQGARLAGAGAIIAVDIDPAKLVLAARMGATHGVDASKDDAVAAGKARDQRPRRRRRDRGGRQRLGVSGDHRGGAARRPDHLARQDRRQQGRRRFAGAR